MDKEEKKMRISYYVFPSEMSVEDCIKAYLKVTSWTPDMDDIEDKINLRSLKNDIEERGETVCSVSLAKKMLRDIGGNAYTRHIDRNGGMFETTPITLAGNNSRHRYNRHL